MMLFSGWYISGQILAGRLGTGRNRKRQQTGNTKDLHSFHVEFLRQEGKGLCQKQASGWYVRGEYLREIRATWSPACLPLPIKEQFQGCFTESSCEFETVEWEGMCVHTVVNGLSQEYPRVPPSLVKTDLSEKPNASRWEIQCERGLATLYYLEKKFSFIEDIYFLIYTNKFKYVRHRNPRCFC